MLGAILIHLMNTPLFITILFLATIVFQGCDDDKHFHVCQGKYGSDQIKDSLVRRYHFSNVYFAQWYKDYLPPNHLNCDTITLVIGSDTIPFSHNDTFALSVASVFFNDTANRDVKCLKIEVNDLRPFGKVKVYFQVVKDDFNKRFIPKMPLDSADMKYEIKRESSTTEKSQSGTNYGISIIVDVKEDYNDIEKLASTIKSQYDSVIKAKKLTQFRMELIIQSPACKLCTGKTYNFYYSKSNKNI
jgi:hypothetical protein